MKSITYTCIKKEVNKNDKFKSLSDLTSFFYNITSEIIINKRYCYYEVHMSYNNKLYRIVLPPLKYMSITKLNNMLKKNNIVINNINNKVNKTIKEDSIFIYKE